MNALPPWAEKLLRFVCPDEFYEQIEGDLIEMYNHEVSTLGTRKARFSLMFKVIRFIRPGIIFRRRNKHLANSNFTTMFSHDFKFAFRSMRRDKLFAGINIAGLAIGITCTLLILAWIQFEYSYNHFIRNYKDIYIR